MTEEKKQKADRKKEKKSKKKAVLIIFLIIIVIAAALFYLVPTLMNRARPNVDIYDEYSTSAETADENLLFSVDSSRINDITALSSGGYITTGNSLISVKNDGSIVDITKPGYSMPVTKAAGKRYMVFERSTGNFAIMGINGTMHSSKTEGEIINADISQSGNYIIISRKTLSTMLVTVYSKNNEIIFQWECNETYLTGCAISANGKNFAVISFDVENGEQVSKVITFTVKSVDVENEIELQSDIVYALRYLNDNTLGIVTDNRYIISPAQGEIKETINYEYDVVSGVAFGSGNRVAVLKSDFGLLDNSNITVFDRSGKEIFDVAINENVTDFCLDSSFVYVLSPSKITVYALSSGELVSSIETTGGLKYIDVFSGNIFCASDTGIYKYSR